MIYTLKQPVLIVIIRFGVGSASILLASPVGTNGKVYIAEKNDMTIANKQKADSEFRYR